MAEPVVTEVTDGDLDAIEIGAAILGTGGGGNPYIGKLRCREELRKGRRIPVTPLDALADDALISAEIGGATSMEPMLTAAQAGLPVVDGDGIGRPRAMTPDLICCLDLETGQPITTEQRAHGFRVIVVGLPCDPQWRSGRGLCLIGPGYFGNDHTYQPIETMNQNQ